MKRLDGKSALITGAARGIGKAFAKAYVAEGATVAIGDIDVARAEESAAEIGPGAYVIRLDVTDQDSIDAAIRTVEEKTGGLDILVNNTGVFDLAPIVEITRESYGRLFDINVAGTLFTLQAGAKSMIARGKGGKIINMASQAGRRGESLAPVYCATKAALQSFTTALRYQAETHGNRVREVEVVTALVETEMTAGRGRGKLTPEQAAGEVIAGLRRSRARIWVGKTALLRRIHRLAPGLAARMLRRG